MAPSRITPPSAAASIAPTVSASDASPNATAAPLPVQLLYKQAAFRSTLAAFHSRTWSFLSRLADFQSRIRDYKGADAARLASCQAQVVTLHNEIAAFAGHVLALETAAIDASFATARGAFNAFPIDVARLNAHAAALDLRVENLALSVAELRA